MKIVGVLSWWDEDPQWLMESVSSAFRLCDEVIALDGAYEGFPSGGAESPSGQKDALIRAGARVHGGRLWRDQMEKRTELFRLATNRTETWDWVFVFDADDLVVCVPADTRDRLACTRYDVAVYTLGGDRYHRGLFRSLRGLRVEDAHYHYVANKYMQTVHLRGEERHHKLEPFANLTDLRVEHRTSARPPERRQAAAEYRRLVAERGIEATTPEEWAAA